MKRKFQKTLKHALCYVLALGMVAGSVLPAKADGSATLIAKYDFENVSGTTVPNVASGASGFQGSLKGSNVSIEADTVLGKSLKFTDGTEGHMLIENIVNTGTTVIPCPCGTNMIQASAVEIRTLFFFSRAEVDVPC